MFWSGLLYTNKWPWGPARAISLQLPRALAVPGLSWAGAHEVWSCPGGPCTSRLVHTFTFFIPCPHPRLCSPACYRHAAAFPCTCTLQAPSTGSKQANPTLHANPSQPHPPQAPSAATWHNRVHAARTPTPALPSIRPCQQRLPGASWKLSLLLLFIIPLLVCLFVFQILPLRKSSLTSQVPDGWTFRDPRDILSIFYKNCRCSV